MGVELLLALTSHPAPSCASAPAISWWASPKRRTAARRPFRQPFARPNQTKAQRPESPTPAPDFRLPRLDGRGEISLSELRGKRVLLILSDPHCGLCQELAPQLKTLHPKHAEIEVLTISRRRAR